MNDLQMPPICKLENYVSARLVLCNSDEIMSTLILVILCRGFDLLKCGDKDHAFFYQIRACMTKPSSGMNRQDSMPSLKK